MSENIKSIAGEKDNINRGILVSAVIVFAGLLPEVHIWSINIIPSNSIGLLFIGLSSLFYFMSIKINQYEKIDQDQIWIVTPDKRGTMSKQMFGISIIFFILFILTGGYQFFTLILK